MDIKSAPVVLHHEGDPAVAETKPHFDSAGIGMAEFGWAQT